MPVTVASGRAWAVASEVAPAPQPMSMILAVLGVAAARIAAFRCGVRLVKLRSVRRHSAAQTSPILPVQS
jgi:hypothetical protein